MQVLRPLRRDRGLRWLLLALVALSLADQALTLVGLQHGAVEVSPIFRPIFARSIPLGILLHALVVGVILAGLIALANIPSLRRYVRWEALFFAVVMVAVVASNAWTLLHTRF